MAEWAGAAEVAVKAIEHLHNAIRRPHLNLQLVSKTFPLSVYRDTVQGEPVDLETFDITAWGLKITNRYEPVATLLRECTLKVFPENFSDEGITGKWIRDKSFTQIKPYLASAFIDANSAVRPQYQSRIPLEAVITLMNKSTDKVDLPHGESRTAYFLITLKEFSFAFIIDAGNGFRWYDNATLVSYHDDDPLLLPIGEHPKMRFRLEGANYSESNDRDAYLIINSFDDQELRKV